MLIMKNLNLNRTCLLAAVLVALQTSIVLACSVPVFRYALERWDSEPYLVEIVSDGELTGKPKEAADLFEKYAKSRETMSNFVIRYVDLNEGKPVGEVTGQSEPSDISAPQVNVYFPVRYNVRVPILTSDLTKKFVREILESPMRTEIASLMLKGESIVWMFLKSGDEKKDANALKLLEERLGVLEKELRLPDDPFDYGEAGGPGSGPQTSAEGEASLRLAFSVVELDRNDPKESFLIKALLRTEADLAELNEPMAFPIFGRGIVLYALVGEGINADNIRDACEFLIGPCSCQIKSWNPGVDLLVTADWYGGLEELLYGEPQEIPELTGIIDSMPDPEPKPEPKSEPEPELKPQPAKPAPAKAAPNPAPVPQKIENTAITANVDVADDAVQAEEAQASPDVLATSQGGNLMHYVWMVVIGACIVVLIGTLAVKSATGKNQTDSTQE